jgi:very-short-patch-repair endonuclease
MAIRKQFSIEHHFPHLKDRFELLTGYTNDQYKLELVDNNGLVHIEVACSLQRKTWKPIIRTAKDKTAFWIGKAKEVHGDTYDYSKTVYNGVGKHLTITCPIHDKDFIQREQVHLKKCGCPTCKVEKVTKFNKRKYNIDMFTSFVKLYKDRYELVSPYTVKNRLTIADLENGGELHHMVVNSFRNGCSPSFKSVIDKDTYQLKRYNELHGQFSYPDFKYKNAYSNIQIICPKHGLFECSSSNHLSGAGCPLCRVSRGERIITNYLTKHDISFISQKKFETCKNINHLPFDFHITDTNILIEFDGKQHYKPVPHWGGVENLKKIQKNDQIKTKWAEQNEYRLIRIKYTKLKKIDSILDEVCLSL